MKPLPETDTTIVLRTDFSDDAEWSALCEAVQALSEDGFQAQVDCISDTAYDGLTVEQLVALAPKGPECGIHTFAFIADQVTFANSDRPILVVNLRREPGRTFRVIPSEMWGVENNLSIANMDFDEFADNVDQDGVFRGFP